MGNEEGGEVGWDRFGRGSKRGVRWDERSDGFL